MEVVILRTDALDYEKWSRFLSLPEAGVLDLPGIIKKMKDNRIINKARYRDLLLKYSVGVLDIGSMWTQFIRDLAGVKFGDFISVLRDCGYDQQVEHLLKHRNVDAHAVYRRTLDNEGKLTVFYATNKSLADDEAFNGGSRYHLEKMTVTYANALIKCTECPEKQQFHADRLAMIFYMLSHTYPDIESRMNVMRRMRDVIHQAPVDRTVADIIYHISMRISQAMKGNYSAAVKHEELTASILLTLHSPLLCLLKDTGDLYVADAQQSPSQEAYLRCSRLSCMFTREEMSVFKTITDLSHARTLLGIGMNFEIREIRTIPFEDRIQAGDIILAAAVPKDQRRKLWYYMCRGRLCELSDVSLAIKFVDSALSFATERSDKLNVQKYKQKLVSQGIRMVSN